MTQTKYEWARPGDVNAFFGLMLDNIADLVLTVGLLSAVFGFPVNFALGHMVPGTAIGVFVGDILFFFMAVKLARRLGKRHLTAMPLGLDTPSTFGMVFFVLGPAFLAAKQTAAAQNPAFSPDEINTAAAIATWHIGICCIFVSGIFKFVCAFFSNWIHRIVPRAGLLGSLAAIALVLISFLPLLEILHFPVAGFAALAVILTTLVARLPIPGKIPGALGALLVGGGIYYAMLWAGLMPHEIAPAEFKPADGLLPTGWLSVFTFQWVYALDDTLKYLPIVIPFALATVVGGIDCTESAKAAGDDFDTGHVIGVEAIATLVASLCGGVIQTTPYIGHPAYKAMGGSSAYTLATAIFVGAAGVFGFFGYLFFIIPKPAVFPILVFIGLEITAQSFRATPRRHYPAVALACVPALAALGILLVDKVFGALFQMQVIPFSGYYDPMTGALRDELMTLRILSANFIVTSLIWASILASLIDRKLSLAMVFTGIAAACSFFGVIHSPLPGGEMFLPWMLEGYYAYVPYHFACGYLAIAILFLLWSFFPLPAWQDHEEDDPDAPAKA